MSDLAEFLLARIAEEEEAADRAVNWTTKNGLAWIGPTPERATVMAMSGERLFAECQAKRAILEVDRLLAEHIRAVALSDAEEARDARNTRTGVRVALQALALPYAEHPDYQAEWRP